MRKIFLVSMVLLLVMAFIAPALAMPVDEVTTYGFSPERNREAKVDGNLFHLAWYHGGSAGYTSFSEPLILDGDHWGGRLAGKTVVLTVEGNRLCGYVLDAPTLDRAPTFHEEKPEWWVQLSGDKNTKSDPTFVDRGNRKYVYVGTYSHFLNLVDITDFFHPTLKKFNAQYATDITSSPLVLDWHGHEVAVATTGNTGKVLLVVDQEEVFYVDAGAGRTSSSPAPVAGGRAFAVGLDQGPSRGELRIYYLDDLLDIRDGEVVQVSQKARVAERLYSGLAGSFAVDGDVLYFGDQQSHLYAYDTKHKTFLWKNRTHAPHFAHRSPALTSDTVYWSAVEKPGQIIALDKATGRTRSVSKQFSSRAQTPPTVASTPTSKTIWAGTGGGWMVGLHADDLQKERFKSFQVVTGALKDKFGSGVAGTVSAAGKWAVASTEAGIIAWRLADRFNLQAVDLQTGIPEGEKAQPGQTYQGTATFKYESGDYGTVPEAPVGVFVNGEYVTLTDENGKELPKRTIDKQTFYYLEDLKRGEERTVYFTWKATRAGKITAVINLDKPPVMWFFQEDTFEDNELTVPIPMDAVNLVAVSIDPGTDEAKPGQRYRGTVTFANDADVPVTNVPVAFYNNEYRGCLTDDSGNKISRVDFPALSERTYNFEWQAPPSGTVTLKGVIDTPPLPDDYAETDETDNICEAEAPVIGAPVKSSGTLTFHAINQAGHKGLGPVKHRPVNEAKWTDWVTAILKPKAPTPPKGTLVSWEITSAKLTYPKKHPCFTFGSPWPPQGTRTINMTPKGHTAVAEFEEDWSLNGAPIYARWIDCDGSFIDEGPIPGPTPYTITAQYTIKYTYQYQVKHRDCDTVCDAEGNCHRDCDTWYETVTKTGTTSGTASQDLLVTGTGVGSYAG
ncbi:MAG: PQQ-binding-like beta-propeller repeat protein [Peptococcaceae bacterium]|nr:PQQ-binding-like beta-propeller repeat protein [Peptococcaceae bacterium]